MAREKSTVQSFVPVLSPEALEKAAELRRQINALEAEYRRLLDPQQALRHPLPVTEALLPDSTSLRVRKSMAKGQQAMDDAVAAGPSKPSGRARRISDLNNMSLREAVERALRIAGGPQTIDGILRKLRMIHYRFHEGTDPVRFLSDRIYNLAGVKAVGGGHFDLLERIEKSAGENAVSSAKAADPPSAPEAH